MNKQIIAFLLFMGLLNQVFGQAKGNINYQEQFRQNSANLNQFSNRRTSLNASFTPSTDSYFINDSTMEIGANVLINVRAQEYVAILSISQAGKTAKVCNETIENRIQSFGQGLQQQGFRSEDIYVDFISQIPTFEFEIEKKIFSKTANEVPSGFELKKNVHIRFQDIKKLDQIMVIAADQEIYDLVKVDYYIPQEKMNSIYDSLRNTALSIIDRKLESFEKLQFKFGPEQFVYKTFSEDLSSVYPVERYSSYKAYSTSAVQADLKVKRNIKKTPTYFYDKVPYNYYDAVLNPVILEPAIQFSYALAVRFSLKGNK